MESNPTIEVPITEVTDEILKMGMLMLGFTILLRKAGGTITVDPLELPLIEELNGKNLEIDCTQNEDGIITYTLTEKESADGDNTGSCSEGDEGDHEGNRGGEHTT